MERAPHLPLIARSPLAQLALALALGIFVGYLLTISPQLALGCSLAAWIAALVLVVIRKLTLSGGFLLLAVFCAGVSLAAIEVGKPAPNQLRRLLDEGAVTVVEPIELTGVVTGPVDFARDRFYFTLSVERLSLKGVGTRAVGEVAFIAGATSEQARVGFEKLELRHGAQLRVATTLNRTDSYLNPGVNLLTEYLERKGFDATGFIKSPLLIERLEDRPAFWPLARLFEWRSILQRRIDSSFSSETAGVLDAALLGNRYNLSQATAERFRNGGTFHVLVISGLHISFIGSLVLLVVRRLTKRRGLQFLSSVIVLWAYTLAVGAESSVVRSALMFTLVALAPIIFRPASSLNALGGAALTLLVWRPRNLVDPSFQLTFLSVLAIVVLAWPLMQKMRAIGSWQPTHQTPCPPSCHRSLRFLCESLYWSEASWQKEISQSVYRCRLFKSPLAGRLERFHLQRPGRYVLNALVVSASVQIALLPVLIVYFHRVSVASLVLNIGVSLLMAALSIVGLVALLLANFNATAAAPLIALAELLNWSMVHSVDPFTRLGLASFRLPSYSGSSASIYGLYYVPITVLTVVLWRWDPFFQPAIQSRVLIKFMSLLQTLMLAVIVLHPFSTRRPDGKLHVEFLDVGQGDSALVTMPDGATLLVDGGGKPNFWRSEGSNKKENRHDARSIGEAVVSEYLWWKGLDSIDYVLATHADADHIDGLNDVVRNFSVRAALVARVPEADAEFNKFAETLRLRKVPLSIIGLGDQFHFGGVTAAVLWPPANGSAAAPSGNNDSIVLLLKFGERSILLTGDVERGAEDEIVKSNENLRVDVVKVAHHGSKTSSIQPFVISTQPLFAVISVGRTSMFGHPHHEVVERWRSAGAEVLTTGRKGTITVTTDGHALTIDSFVH